MLAVKAKFDGKKVVLPKGIHAPQFKAGKVIVVFTEPPKDSKEKKQWMKAQESSFSKIWDNDEDAVYDNL